MLFFFSHNFLLFVEILFIIRSITFRGIRIQHRQKRHTLPGNFSPLQRVTVATRQALVNDHSRQTHEKFYGRNDAAPEAISASHAKRIASETMTFHFSLASQSRRSNGHLLIGKVLWQSQTARKCPQSFLLAHPEISNEKIWLMSTFGDR
jgi:hypothetical protein